MGFSQKIDSLIRAKDSIAHLVNMVPICPGWNPKIDLIGEYMIELPKRKIQIAQIDSILKTIRIKEE